MKLKEITEAKTMTLRQFDKEYLMEIDSVTNLSHAQIVSKDIVSFGNFERGPDANGSGNIAHTMNELWAADVIGEEEYVRGIDEALRVYKEEQLNPSKKPEYRSPFVAE